jgi:hypothetical protein
MTGRISLLLSTGQAGYLYSCPQDKQDIFFCCLGTGRIFLELFL